MVELEDCTLKEIEVFGEKAERLLGLKLTRTQINGMMVKAAA
jgi:hypothetical protein